jgi:hypothetical protein
VSQAFFGRASQSATSRFANAQLGSGFFSASFLSQKGWVTPHHTQQGSELFSFPPLKGLGHNMASGVSQPAAPLACSPAHFPHSASHEMMLLTFWLHFAMPEKIQEGAKR